MEENMMSEFHSVPPEQFDFSPFRLVGRDWMLITAEHGGRLNSMTASWGGMGVLWGRDVMWAVIRESRFTKTLVDPAETFSLTFFDHEKYAGMLRYMGTVSGRDENKIEKAGLTVLHSDGIPYFAEAKAAVLCRKLCSQPLRPESFTQPWIDPKWYSDRDYHTLYFGEIVGLLAAGQENEEVQA
jgi:flavin reductase (DIM6/NTAB) family NADH-FMN oxidoreductase RutF